MTENSSNRHVERDRSPTTSGAKRFALFTISWTAGTLILIGLTWRLWTGLSDFPQVPLWAPLIACPLFIDWLALALVTISCVALLADSTSVFLGRGFALPPLVRTLLACVFATGLVCLCFLNQHRLQPWAWQFFLYSLILGATAIAPTAPTATRGSGVCFLNGIIAARWLTASIYFYSAIGKFDYQFIHGLGTRLVETAARIFGIANIPWPEHAVMTLPIFELLVAVFLIFSFTRPLGVLMAILFHICLLVTLGPWGLDHHTGVLVWNLFFMAITIVLFWPTRTAQTSKPKLPNAASRIGLELPSGASALILTLALIIYPAFPQCDHWLGWGLYSPSNSRCDFDVIGADKAGRAVFRRVDLGAISLEKLNVPLYPEARFQLGVATALSGSNVRQPGRIVIRSRSDRYTGERKSTVFQPSQHRWNAEQPAFIFNWQARSPDHATGN